MTEILADTMGIAQGLLWAGFLVFLRLGAMFSLLPGIGERSLSVRVRLVLALSLSAMLTPLVDPGPMAVAFGDQVMLGAKEIAIGLILGLGVRFLAHVLLIAGAIAAQATSLAQLFGNAMNDGPQPAIALVFYWAGIALFMLTGMPVRIVLALAETYTLVPIGAGLPADWSLSWAVDAVARAFSLGFTLAAPFVVAALLYNVAMGVINKAMPQLMVAFVGAPALTAGGLLLLMLSAPVVLTVWYDALLIWVANPFGGLP